MAAADHQKLSPHTQLASRIAQKGGATCAWVTQDPMLGRVFAQLPFDAVVYDLQHSRNTAADIMRVMPSVVLAGKPVIVRVPIGAFSLAGQLMDAGASCIIAPMISTPGDARSFVSHCKYKPLGERSWGPFEAVQFSGMSRPEYLANANGFSLTLAMIETKAGLENIEDILAVEGLDGIFVGPFDLAIDLTNGQRLGGDGPEVDEALDRIAAACRRAKKIAGIYCINGEAARAARGRGFDLMGLGSDTAFMSNGALQMLETARAVS